MNRFLVKALIGLALIPLAAHAADPRINREQARQHARIAQGVKSGELTHQEAKGLRDEERQIRQEERAYRADGKLTHAERKDLRGELHENSRALYREKHDAETRP